MRGSRPQIGARRIGSKFAWPLLVVGTLASRAVPLAADDRSTEVFQYTCSNQLGRRDITLFANGTVRLRQGLWDEQEMLLDELLTEELQSYLRQLKQILDSADPLATGSLRRGELHHGAGPERPQASSGQQRRSATEGAGSEGLSSRAVPNKQSSRTWSPHGEWVDDCEIVLELPGGGSQSWRFTALDVPPLAVTHLMNVADDLADFTRTPSAVDRVAADYRPQRGDLLVTLEGERYRVLAMTVDGRGVELEGVDSPMRIYVALEELPNAFASVDKPGRR